MLGITHRSWSQCEFGAGADLGRSGGRALIAATQEGHIKCIEKLIQSGVDVNSKNRKGTTALMNAALSGNAQCMIALIEAGADVNMSNNKGEMALAKFGKVASYSVVINCVAKLLEAGAEVGSMSVDTLHLGCFLCPIIKTIPMS